MSEVPLHPCANCGVPFPADVLRCPHCCGKEHRDREGRPQWKSSESSFSITFEPIRHDDRSVRWRRTICGTKYGLEGSSTTVGPRWVSEDLGLELPIVDPRRPLLSRPIGAGRNAVHSGDAAPDEGYLGLAIDEERLTLKRGAKSISIKGPMNVKMARYFIESGDRFRSLDDLRSIWKVDRGDADDGTIRNRISMVKTFFMALGVKIDNVPGLGWRLADCDIDREMD